MKNLYRNIWLVLCILISSNFVSADNKKATKLVNDGQSLLFQGKYGEAIKTLKKAVKEAPESSGALLYLARAYSYNSELSKAEEPLKQILAKQADHIEAGQLLAQIYDQQHKYKELVSILKPLLEFRHDYPNYQLLARATYKLNNLTDSQKYYEEAVKLNNKNPQDYYNLGNIYLINLEYAKAAEAYNKAASLKLDTPQLHYKLATVYFNLRNYFGRVQQIEVKSGEEGELFKEWYLLEQVSEDGSSFLASPKMSAVYHVAKVMKSKLGEKFDIKLLQANIFLSGSRFRQAKKIFNSLKASVPKEDEALFNYYFSQACLGSLDYDGFLQYLQQAISLDKKAYGKSLVSAYLTVASHYRQDGVMKKSIEFVKKALSNSPKNAGLHLQLASDYEVVESFKKATLHWQMVLALESDHPQRIDIVNLIEKYRNQ